MESTAATSPLTPAAEIEAQEDEESVEYGSPFLQLFIFFVSGLLFILLVLLLIVVPILHLVVLLFPSTLGIFLSLLSLVLFDVPGASIFLVYLPQS